MTNEEYNKENDYGLTFKQILEIDLGSAYNNYKTLDKYGSANGLIEEMIRIFFTVMNKQIDKLDSSDNPKIKTKHGAFKVGYFNALNDVKDILK